MTQSQPAPAPVVSKTSSIAPTELPLPARLFVPLPSGAMCKPAGTRVTRGESLIESETESAPSPADGTVVRVTEVERLGLSRVPAVELEVDYAAPHEPIVEKAIDRPRDVSELIARLR